MLCLYLEAPFAVCRTFTAGWYRPTAAFLTPSAAYGLILNAAGIESRLREEDEGHDGRVPASLTRPGLPSVRLAIGVPGGDPANAYPRVQTIFQQLHNYPVGASGADRAADARGAKYNITPVRREFLSDLRAFVLVDGNSELEDRIREGLAGNLPGSRYGLPFLGDNQFLIDRLEEWPWPMPGAGRAFWYERIEKDGGQESRARTSRLTVWIDRADLSRTISALYAPTPEATPEPPERAWTQLPPT